MSKQRLSLFTDGDSPVLMQAVSNLKKYTVLIDGYNSRLAMAEAHNVLLSQSVFVDTHYPSLTSSPHEIHIAYTNGCSLGYMSGFALTQRRPADVIVLVNRESNIAGVLYELSGALEKPLTVITDESDKLIVLSSIPKKTLRTLHNELLTAITQIV